MYSLLEVMKRKDLSFTYVDYYNLYREAFGKAGAPTRQQFVSDLSAIEKQNPDFVRPYYRLRWKDLNQVTNEYMTQETAYYHKPFESVHSQKLMEEE